MVMAVLEVASRTTSLVLLGTLPHDQLVAVFQLAVAAPLFQVQMVVAAFTGFGLPKSGYEKNNALDNRTTSKAPVCTLVA